MKPNATTPYQFLPFFNERKQWRCGYCMAPLSRYGGNCPYCGTEFEDKLLGWLLGITKIMGPIIVAKTGLEIAKLLMPKFVPGGKSK